ncbi:DUF6879 family protein [Amycolatopsis aidingensis]|uniref:DUF6879 family protein n=1 Tax=Amycolatopsis aidingensis TaxID=2842453 RepID=UPI001C0BD0BE|nr:DUF6879 family protein [Amycolatopsis aidingensis]
MPEVPHRPAGEQLTPDDYLHDFFPRFWRITEHDFWKLERRQSFQEKQNASWEAFARGEWDEAMRRLEERSANLKDYYAKVARHGFTTYRVRVVEEPLTPYLQWQLHSQRQRGEHGEHVRVVDGDTIAPFEVDERLPEIVTVGTEAVYEVRYDSDGAIEGAIRSDDPRDVTLWRDFIRSLYDSGEDINSFFEREVAQLDPPRLT